MRLQALSLLFCLAHFLISQEQINTIDQFIEAGKFQEALNHCDQLLSAGENSRIRFLIQSKKGDAYYYLGDIRNSLRHYLMALNDEAILEEENKIILQQTYSNVGFCYSELGAHVDAKKYYEQSLLKAVELHDSVEVAVAYFNISNALLKQGHIKEGITKLRLAYEMDLIRKDTSAIAFDLNALGYAQLELGDPVGAINYFRQSINLLSLSSGNYNSLATRNNNISKAYLQLKSLDSALYYNSKSIEIHEKYKDSVNLAKRWIDRASILNEYKQYESALIWTDAAQRLLGNLSKSSHIISANHVRAESLIGLNRLNEAMRLCALNVQLSKEFLLPKNLIQEQLMLADIQVRMGDFEEASRNYQEILMLKDSLRSIETQQIVADLEVKYQVDRIEQENEILLLENDLKDANLARARNAQYALAVGGGSLLIVLIVFFTLRHKKVKAEQEAQELQVEALKKRFMELHASPSELAVAMDMKELNEKLHTELTEREFEALHLSIEGKSNTEIADKLFISVSTVKFHLRNAYGKMGVGNRKEAFQFMLKSS
jgi:ATP/maltotriose-dependent transcriptional regulator MalT